MTHHLFTIKSNQNEKAFFVPGIESCHSTASSGYFICVIRAYLALNKTAYQSSTYQIFTDMAMLAVDGRTSGTFSQLSVTHTKYNSNPWWEVDLDAEYDIDKIEIWNRTDCCSERLSNYDIFVKRNPNETGLKFNTNRIRYQSGEAASKTINGNRRGRYVRIQKYGSGFLSLAEVKVYEKREPVTFCLFPTPRLLTQTVIMRIITRKKWKPLLKKSIDLTELAGQEKLGE